MQLLIDPRGTARALYGEEIDLAALSRVSIRRASRVEPDLRGRWWALLRPVGGPRLGPFARRSETLAAERAWLETHGLPGRAALARAVGRATGDAVQDALRLILDGPPPERHAAHDPPAGDDGLWGAPAPWRRAPPRDPRRHDSYDPYGSWP
jgi:hypothetical protein